MALKSRLKCLFLKPIFCILFATFLHFARNTTPDGGTVCFLKYYFDLKSETFAKLLLAEKGVFFVPGSCFDKEYYFRLGLAQDSKLFKAGLNELSNFVDEHLIS